MCLALRFGPFSVGFVLFDKQRRGGLGVVALEKQCTRPNDDDDDDKDLLRQGFWWLGMSSLTDNTIRFTLQPALFLVLYTVGKMFLLFYTIYICVYISI